VTLHIGLSDVGRESRDAEVLSACQEVVVVFCEMLDAGDAVGAFALHDEDLAFYPPGAPAPVGRDAARTMGERMLHAYDGRRTVHVVNNFVGRRIAPDRVEAQYVVTVYELTRDAAGVAEERDSPAIFALAHERAVFRRGDDGAWRYAEQRMLPLAPLSPFGKDRR